MGKKGKKGANGKKGTKARIVAKVELAMGRRDRMWPRTRLQERPSGTPLPRKRQGSQRQGSQRQRLRRGRARR
jgi:hypothetical protein